MGKVTRRTAMRKRQRPMIHPHPEILERCANQFIQANKKNKTIYFPYFYKSDLDFTHLCRSSKSWVNAELRAGMRRTPLTPRWHSKPRLLCREAPPLTSDPPRRHGQ